jgi:hypothetical protein
MEVTDEAEAAQITLQDLPDEIVALLLSKVPGPDLVRLGSTSRSFLKLVRSSALHER